jgi:hypothetical protein
MKRLFKTPFLQLTAIVLACLSLVHCASVDSSYSDQQALPVRLGSQSGCQVSASHALGNNLGKVRLAADSIMRSTYADLFTGKSLTNTEVLRRVSSAFGRAATAAPGSNLYTLGDLKYGGEAQFIAQAKGGVTIQYFGNSDGSTTFDGQEVRILKDLIDQALAR